MTREEAINLIADMDSDKYTAREAVALTMAINALEQGMVLDTIRAEIESQREEVIKKYFENAGLSHYYIGINDGLKYARNIIDKYKESEDKA